MKRSCVFFLTVIVIVMAFTISPSRAENKEITIGYQLIFNPWKVAIAQGDFEKETGYKINWRKFDSPGKLLPAMTSGDVQIGLMGSTGVTTAMTRGIDVELVWIGEGIAAAEALVVRNAGFKGQETGRPFCLHYPFSYPFRPRTVWHRPAGFDHIKPGTQRNCGRLAAW